MCVIQRLKILVSKEPLINVALWFTERKVKECSGDWRGLDVTFPGVEKSEVKVEYEADAFLLLGGTLRRGGI